MVPRRDSHGSPISLNKPNFMYQSPDNATSEGTITHNDNLANPNYMTLCINI